MVRMENSGCGQQKPKKVFIDFDGWPQKWNCDMQMLLTMALYGVSMHDAESAMAIKR